MLPLVLFGAASSPLCKFRTPSVRRLFGIGVMLRPRYVRTIRDRPVSPRHSPHHAQLYDILHLHRKTFIWCERCGRVFYSLHKVIGHVPTKALSGEYIGRWLVNQLLQTPFLQSGDKSGENCSRRSPGNIQHPSTIRITKGHCEHPRIAVPARVLFDSGVVGIKCFFVVTFVSVAHKLQHLRQI